MFTNQKPDLALIHIPRITVWGVGLIGDSVGLALKKNGSESERIGLGRDIGRLKIAQEIDAVDKIANDVTEGCLTVLTEAREIVIRQKNQRE